MLTIVIPTKSRPAFLKRCLGFLNAQNCLFPIIIGDSSTGKDLQKNKFTISNLKKLKIKHIIEEDITKDLKGWQTDFVTELLPTHIKTKYTALISDDDFFFIDALND